MKRVNVGNAERKRTEDALRESEERYRQLFVEAPLGIALVDSLTGRILEVNPMFARMAGRTTEAMALLDWMSITHPDDVQENLDNMALLNAGGTSGFQMETRILRHDRTPVWINMTIASVHGEDTARPRHLCMIEDITGRKQLEDRLRQLSRAVDQSPASILITNPAGGIEYANPKFFQVTGYTPAEVLGRNPRILKSGATSPEGYRAMWQTITAGKEWRGEFHNKKKNGELYWESASISPIRDAAGVVTHFVAVKEDITARKQTEAERDQLIQELQRALASVKSLSGLLPICAGCKKIRDDQGYWSQVESYIQTHSEATFSHSMCPSCVRKWYPELETAP